MAKIQAMTEVDNLFEDAKREEYLKTTRPLFNKVRQMSSWKRCTRYSMKSDGEAKLYM